ncbi:MAG: anthranilate synthase component II [Bacteroidota bacterium]
MILIVDNYDSFTYNLVQLVGQYTSDFIVLRNDKIERGVIELEMGIQKILISPGPGRPENAGICVETIKQYSPYIPVLGVCLGHQAIGYAFGAKIVNAPVLMHGKTSQINHTGKGIFANIDTPFEATRYHSLIISKENFPDDLEVTAHTDDGIIMGIRHKKYPVEGVQFHPESILTKVGAQIIRNWLMQDIPSV